MRSHYEIIKRWRKRNPGAQNAQAAVLRAVRSGLIDKPARCEKCHREAPLDAHHYAGYEQPLHVFWLCRPCHRLESIALEPIPSGYAGPMRICHRCGHHRPDLPNFWPHITTCIDCRRTDIRESARRRRAKLSTAPPSPADRDPDAIEQARR